LRKGLEKLPYGMVVRLPTALELIAKINIHYCNYFLRRGYAEGATTIAQSAGDRQRGIMRMGMRGEERARVCETETKASVYICNESFIDVVVVAG